MIAELLKTAAEMKRKTTMVESCSDHCPHCDFEFGEKCYPVVKDKGVRVSSIDKVYETGEYDEHCPECDGVIDQKERTDDELDGDNWLAYPGAKEQAKARRDAQRRRKAEREGQEKKADMWTGDEAAEKKLRTEELARARKDPDYVTKFKGTRRGTWPEVEYAISVLEREQVGQEKKASEACPCSKAAPSDIYTCRCFGGPMIKSKGWEKKASRTKEIQELLNDSDIPDDIYFFTDGKERATVCIGDWHDDTESDIAIQFGMANWDNFERPDDTEIGKPSWATMALCPRRKGLRKNASIASLLRQARNATHEHPTEAQRRAGNYAMGTFRYKGLTIKIENPKDSIRRGKDKHGKAWESRMPADYGFFKGSEAIDGDAVDVFVGPDLDSDMVVAIDQIIDGKYDETKFLVAVKSQAQAEKLYLSAYQKGWKLGDVSTTTVQQLKEWLKDGDHKKPFKGQMVKAAAWWNKSRTPSPTDPAALKFLPKNVKDLLAVTFGGKWTPKKQEPRRKAR